MGVLAPSLTGLGVTYHGGRAGIEPRDGGRELLPTIDSAVMRSLRMYKVCLVEFATKGKERSLIYESGVRCLDYIIVDSTKISDRPVTASPVVAKRCSRACVKPTKKHHQDGQSQAIVRVRPVGLEPLEQGLRALNKEWQGPENRPRIVPATGHTMRLQPVRQLLEDGPTRCRRKR